MPKFARLRRYGPFGSFLANVLSLLTVNWWLVVSTIFALLTASVRSLREAALSPTIYVGIGSFLVVL